MDDARLSDHLRAAIHALANLRNLLRTEYREDREVIEHELGNAETSIRRVLALVVGDL